MERPNYAHIPPEENSPASEILWEQKGRHWFYIAKPAAAIGASIAAGAFIASENALNNFTGAAVAAAIGVSGVWLGKKAIESDAKHFKVEMTTTMIHYEAYTAFLHEKIANKNYPQDQISDMDIDHGPIEQLCKTGKLTFDTSSEGIMNIPNIRNPLIAQKKYVLFKQRSAAQHRELDRAKTKALQIIAVHKEYKLFKKRQIPREEYVDYWHEVFGDLGPGYPKIEITEEAAAAPDTAESQEQNPFNQIFPPKATNQEE